MELMLLGQSDEENRRYMLANGEILIGRRPDCDIVLNAPSIATRHARVFSLDEQAVIYGIEPEWPVYVNGNPVGRRVLEDGDSIELAHYRLRFVRQRAAQPTTFKRQPDNPEEPVGDDTLNAPDVPTEALAEANVEGVPASPEVPLLQFPVGNLLENPVEISRDVGREVTEPESASGEVPDEPGEEHAEDLTTMSEGILRELDEEVPEELTEETPEEPIEKVLEKLTEAMSERILRELDEEVPQELTEETPEVPTQKAAEEHAGDLTEEMSQGILFGKVHEEVVGGRTEEVPEEVAEAMFEGISEETHAEVSEEEATEEVTGEVPEEVIEELTEAMSQGIFGRGSEKVPEETFDKHRPEVPLNEPEEPQEASVDPVETAIEGISDPLPSSPFHLDILSGINQGRRVTLTNKHVVLGFDQQRLVEITVNGDDLSVRTVSEDVDASLNGEPIPESPTEAVPGDVLWLRRISMRIHQG